MQAPVTCGTLVALIFGARLRYIGVEIVSIVQDLCAQL